MEMLFSSVVLAIIVPTSLCCIMLSTWALIHVADYVVSMRKGFHSVYWELWQGQRPGGRNVSDQAARTRVSEQMRRFRSQSDMPEADSCKLDGALQTILWNLKRPEHSNMTSMASAMRRREVELNGIVAAQRDGEYRPCSSMQSGVMIG